MSIEFHGIPVNVIKSRRKTAAIQLVPGEIIVRVPNRMSQREIQAILAEKSTWIEAHQKQLREREEVLKSLPKFTEEELEALADRARNVIPERVRHYAPMVEVDYGRITIRSQHTRWGSCSHKGNLNFNCLLMLAPNEVIDCVVVHELCHRKHMDHSKAFYEEVERVFPEYRQCRKWLKENGSTLLMRLP